MYFLNWNESSLLRERDLQGHQADFGFRISVGEKWWARLWPFLYLCAKISMHVCVSDCLNVFFEWLQVSHENFLKHKLYYLNPLFYFDHGIKDWKYLTSVLVTCRVLKDCYVDCTFFSFFDLKIKSNTTNIVLNTVQSRIMNSVCRVLYWAFLSL